MPEATLVRAEESVMSYTAEAAYSSGDVIQLRNGLAAVLPDAASGTTVGAVSEGIWKVAKTANIVILDGGQVFWDHSANTATYNQVSDRDFYLGTAVGDAAAADSFVNVNLNVMPAYKVELHNGAFLSVLAGTAAAGGFGYPVSLGASAVLELTATNEAQKVDLLSAQGFAVGSKPIIEGAFRVLSDGSGSATDVSFGLASATHATDADSIAESAFIHLNGNDTNIYAECDDGTNETAATDTTIDYTEGSGLSSRVEFWIDCRSLSSLKFYVNGARVLSGTTFSVAAAAGAWYLLAHVEKTSSTDTYKIALDWLRCRIGQQ